MARAEIGLRESAANNREKNTKESFKSAADDANDTNDF